MVAGSSEGEGMFSKEGHQTSGGLSALAWPRPASKARLI